MIRALALAFLLAGPAEAACRQALALALDVSGSVDAREYRLQTDGIAAALENAEVRARLLEMPDAPVRMMVLEWSGPGDERVLLPWTEVRDAGVLAQMARTLRGVARREATPGTALGTAMSSGAAHLATQADCWKHTLDISGDGKNNLGPRPRDVRDALEGSGLTINGLTVGVDDPQVGDIRQANIAELSAYYRAEVMLGPGAFVVTALGFADYARAMRDKLLRELDTVVLSQRD